MWIVYEFMYVYVNINSTGIDNILCHFGFKWKQSSLPKNRDHFPQNVIKQNVVC